MSRFLSLLLLWQLGLVALTQAQQILCERQFAVTPLPYRRPAALLRLQADSLRLVSDYYPNGPTSYVQARVQRLNLTSCDTVSAGSAVLRVSRNNGSLSLAAVNRRGQVLLAQNQAPAAAGDSSRITLQLFNRNGTSRWRRTLVPRAAGGDGVGDIIEAPENGFFLFGGEYYPAPPGPGISYQFVLRLDSTGRELWRRRYSGFGAEPLRNPVYTRNGNLAGTTSYFSPGAANTVLTVTEFNQRGDSLTTHPIVIVPQQLTRIYSYGTNDLIPLRDGGFALVGQVDSANTGFDRPFLARLDRNLNLTWSYVYRAQATQNMRFAQPRELADGTLVVVAGNLQSGRNHPFWLFRFSATGTLQQRYPFVSQVLTANTGGGRYGYFGVAQGLQALSDSSFVVVAGSGDVNSSRIYLAHLRVPGLPRIIDSHVVPPAILATRAGRAGGVALDLYPNPASETLTVRYARPAGAATLVLTDVLGRAVLVRPLNAGETTVSVRALPLGLYQATVRVAGQLVAAGKLAVTR